MEALVARTEQRLPAASRWLAIVYGARSTFDLYGFSVLRDNVFRRDALTPNSPSETVARDMARVLDRFGRSAACARRALDAGIAIENLKPGCTANGDFAERGGPVQADSSARARSMPKSVG